MTDDELKAMESRANVAREAWPKSAAVACLTADVRTLAAEVRRLTGERDKLQAFKDWVHQYLDSKGVPHHPPGVHGAEGCRIGDRMDWVFALIAELRAAAPAGGTTT